MPRPPGRAPRRRRHGWAAWWAVGVATALGCGGGEAAGPLDGAAAIDAATTDGTPGVDATPDAAVDAAPATCTGRAAQPLDAVWTLTVDGRPRTARVHVPAAYDPTRPTPLVLDFHGYSMTATSQEALTRLPAKADAAGFVVVHANGTGAVQGWNAGACCGTAASTGVDDVGFVDALLAELEARLCVDPDRVYATGFSNGGFLAHRLACERAEVFAAIAPVSGVLGIPACAPSRPVPVLHVHGTADTVVPYAGSAALGFASVATTIDGWVARNGCTTGPTEVFAQGDTTCVSYGGCAGGADVELCTITGGGHTWPGGGPFPGGHQSTDLAATDALWDFFVAHPRR
ncbi:MAG: PHB depolymerase family esterase [Kofleriaceae bacterium]